MTDDTKGNDGAAASVGTASESELAAARRLLSATAIRALAEDRWQKYRPWLDWPLVVLCVLAFAVLFSPATLTPYPVPPVGSIAPATIRAERDFLILDHNVTAEREARAAADTAPIFDYNPHAIQALKDKVRNAVAALEAGKKRNPGDVAGREAAFSKALGMPVHRPVFALIDGLPRPSDLVDAITYFLDFAHGELVVGQHSELPAKGPITLVDLSDRSQRAVSSLNRIVDLADVRHLMAMHAGDAPYGSARVVRSFILDAASDLLQPTLTPDVAATQTARRAAKSQIAPVYVRIKDGQIMVAAGQRVTAAMHERLVRLNAIVASRHPWGGMAAFAILASGLMLLGGWYFRRSGAPNWPSRKQAYLTLSVTLVSALVAIAAYLAGRSFAAGLGLDRFAADFLPPVALVSVLLALLAGARGSLLAGTVLSIFLAFRVDGNALMVSYYLVGILTGGLIARGSRRRADLMRLGLAVGVAQAAAVPVIFVLSNKGLDASLLPAMAAALVSGLLTAFASAGLLPLFEQVFEETTNMRLVELASADSPLLKQLALQSPGTFYHSMIMSNLAEAAGDAIAANGLQCRVMALYHDIGKMVRPSYFAENQRGANIHDRLPPELSARIIFAHIKDGIDLARKNRLGRPVLDAVTQHQGTTLLRVFYLKALERAKTTGESVDENEFRYPGPRPRTREAAILLLADAAEAATRALKEPSPTDLRERVHKVVQEKVADRQLDECSLTLKDLNRIEAAFVRTLTLGVYHSRIEYPPLPRVVPAATKEDSGTPDRDYGRQSSLGERGS